MEIQNYETYSNNYNVAIQSLPNTDTKKEKTQEAPRPEDMEALKGQILDVTA